MQVQVGPTTLELIQGDITQQATEAIVNAANSSLMGGGGVDGAIHRAGGPAILEECEAIVARQGRLPTGQAVITTGGLLRARQVIHTVGPIWSGGQAGEDELLASAYRSSLALAAEHHLSSVAFPSISTGAYRFPLQRAARVALGAVIDFLQGEAHRLTLVRFVLWDNAALRAYGEALAELPPQGVARSQAALTASDQHRILRLLPLVTVVIPTFNRSNALRYAIRSAIGQRFQDFEVLVIGDACTDDSEQVVAEAGDPRLRWHNREQRCGESYGPANVAFGLARGRHIAYLGHDDLWLPNHLEQLVGTLEDGETDLAYSAIEMVWGPDASEVWATDINSEGKRDALFQANFINPSCLLFRRDLVDELGPWLNPKGTGLPPDWEFFQRACRAGKRFAFVPVLTAIKFPSWTRPGVYEERPCDEQAERWELIQRYGDGYASLAYQRALAELERRADGQAQEIEVHSRQLAAGQTEVNALQQEIDARGRQLAAGQTEISTLQQEIDARGRQLAAVRTEMSTLQQEIKALRRSITWRATEPIRRVFAWLNRWRA